MEVSLHKTKCLKGSAGRELRAGRTSVGWQTGPVQGEGQA